MHRMFRDRLVRASGRAMGRSTAGAQPQLLEQLEERAVLSSVLWDGGPSGAGTDFNLAANWAGDILPGPGDDAVINTAGPTITLAAARSVQSVTSSRALQINSGGNLTTTATNALTAPVTVAGGTITGGTWNFSGAGDGFHVTSGGSVFNNAAITGDIFAEAGSASFTLQGSTTFTTARLRASNAGAFLSPNYTLVNPIIDEGATPGSRVVSMGVGSGTASVGPTGSITIAAGAAGDLSIQNNFALTLVNNGMIASNAAGRTLTIQNTAFTNNGSIQANGGAVNLNATTWSNPGSISAVGGTLAFTNAWSSAGSISVDNSTLNLGGTFSSTGLNFAAFSRINGGQVNITGTFTNSLLPLSASTGSWRLQGGTISGGSITLAGGATLQLTNSGGVLNNVAYPADLFADTTSASVTVEGSTTFGTLHLSAGSTTVFLSPGYTLSSAIIVDGAAAGGRAVSLGVTNGTATIAPTGSIALAAGAGGDLSIQNNFALTLVNNGSIANNSTNRSLTIQNTTFTNNGSLQALGGTLTVQATNWTSPGSISATGATVTFAGGWSISGSLSIDNTTLNLNGTFSNAAFNFANFTRTNGGQVNILGTLTNTLLPLSAATGSWRLQGGAIIGGSVAFSGGAALQITNSGGLLNNVAVNGDLFADTTSANVTVQGSTTFGTVHLQASGSTLYLSPGYTLSNAVVAEGAATGSRVVSMGVSNGAATIGATGSITLAAGTAADLFIQNNFQFTLSNNGTISDLSTNHSITISMLSFTNNAAITTSAGGGLTVSGTTFTNNGAITQAGGTLTINATNWTSTAPISGSGATVTLGGSWSTTSSITIDNTTLNLGGTFTTAGLNLPAFVRNNGGQVNITGTLTNSVLPLSAATGSWRLQGGTISGGSVTLAGGASLLLTSGNGTLNNVAYGGDLFADTVSANVTLQGSTTFGTLHLQASGTVGYLSPGYVLTNAIVAEGAATGSRAVSIGVGNGAATIGPTGSITLAAGVGADLSIQNNFQLTLTNNGLIRSAATGHTISFNNTAFTNNGTVEAAAGTISITAPVTLSNFAAGTLTGGTWNVINAGVLNFNTGRDVVTNAATILLDGAPSTFAALAGLTNNSGSLTLANGRAFNFAPAGNVFTNSGTFAKTGSGSTSVPNTITFSNTGTLAVSGGTLTLSGPVSQVSGATLMAGTWNVTDPGVLVITGAALTTVGAGATIRLDGPGSTFAAADTVTANNGTFTLTNSRSFTAASFTNGGTLNVGPGGTFSVSGVTSNSAAINVTAASFSAAGAFNQAATGLVNLASGASLLATGGGSSSGDIAMTGASAAHFNGSHTVAAGADMTGDGALIVDGGSFTTSGVVSLTSATFNGGAASFGGAVTLGAATINPATASFNAPAGIATLTLAGGTLNGSGLVTVSSALNWQGGTMSGSGATSVTGGNLTLSTLAPKTLSRALNNSASASWSGADFTFNGGTFNNLAGATFTSFTGGTLADGGAANLFNNAGTFALSAAATLTVGVPFTNTAQVNAQAGTILLNTGGAYSGDFAITAGARLTLAATSTFSATSHLSGGGGLTVNGGAQTFSGSFTLSGASHFTAGASAFSGAFAAGPFDITAGATVNLNASGSSGAVTNSGILNLNNRTLSTLGGYTQTSTGDLDVRFDGPAAGQFGRIAASGAISLDGSLHITWGYQPTTFVNFDFITGATRSGAFSNAVIQQPGSPRAFKLAYGPAGVRLAVAAPVAST